MRQVFFLFVSMIGVMAQEPEDDPIYHVKAGLTAPTVVRKVEPNYSAEGKSANIQGTVMLAAVVDRQGKPTLIEVVSPLGFGLDEKAVEAVQKWEFTPAKKDGKPVRVDVLVEANFRLHAASFDAKSEKRRTEYNMALRSLKAPHEGEAVDKVRKLSEEKYPPAMYVSGLWLEEGKYGDKDPVAALVLFQKAAEKDYGPALYEIGYRQIEGRGLPLDIEKGLATMRKSALLGSAAAQFYLGHRYEFGKDVPVELDRSQRYFRLCAVQGEPMCRYRLGYLLLKSSRHYLQGVAWLQLASPDVPAARELAARETPKLTEEQVKEIDALRGRLAKR